MFQKTDEEEEANGGCFFSIFLIIIFVLCAVAAPEFLGVLIGILPLLLAAKLFA